jgi:hypothetical protein
MKLLELFSGTGSVGREWKEVISLDIDDKFGADIVTDILKWDHTTLDFLPDFIWGSVPCEQYSIARTRAKTSRNLQLADSLVNKTIDIINYFKNLNPALIWFIENPDSSLLWKRFDFPEYVRLDYCQYGASYRKRTRIATNSNWTPRKLCDPKTCVKCVDGKHLQTAQRGPSRSGTIRMTNDICSLNTLHALPLELTDEIMHACFLHSQQHVG